MPTSFCLLGCPDFSSESTDDKFLMEALRQRGARVRTCDWQTVEPEDGEWQILRSTWDYTETPGVFLEKLSGLSKLINPFSLVEWNLDKVYLHEMIRQGQPVVPSYFPEVTEGSLEEWMLSHPASEYLIKPRIGASGKNILRVEPDDLLDLELQSYVFIQPLQPEIFEAGEVSQMYCESQLSHAVVKTPKAGEFRIQEEWGGTTKLHEPSIEERQLASDILQLLTPSPVYARVDSVLGPSGPILMELELIEPSLYFRYQPESANLYAEALLQLGSKTYQ